MWLCFGISIPCTAPSLRCLPDERSGSLGRREGGIARFSSSSFIHSFIHACMHAYMHASSSDIYAAAPFAQVDLNFAAFCLQDLICNAAMRLAACRTTKPCWKRWRYCARHSERARNEDPSWQKKLFHLSTATWRRRRQEQSRAEQSRTEQTGRTTPSSATQLASWLATTRWGGWTSSRGCGAQGRWISPIHLLIDSLIHSLKN